MSLRYDADGRQTLGGGTTRWEVPNNATSVTSQIRYDIAGSPVAQIDPLGRKVRIGYADVFDTTGNPTTFAYPTTITDPAGATLGDSLHSSTVKYRYDIGANVEAVSPAPAGNTLGKKTTRIFDPVGRLQKETIVNSGAYTRYEYPTNGVQSKVYSTIIDTNSNNTGDSADEVLSESWTDGAGRVRRSRTPHTFDGTGNSLTWAGTIVEYDILGRVSRSSVPTEVSVPDPNNPDTWAPAGDDVTRGWIWNYQYYDWKGRVIRTVPTDSNGTDDKDTLITYDGCGCAGGQITTIKGPKTEAIDMAGIPQTAKRRTQKVYEDILGRTFKTEAWDLDGASIYSTVRAKFNGRDQSLLTTEYQGAEGSGTFQETTATFDGHGRLASSHKPEQRDTNNVLKYTTYSYNADDSIQSVTDGRGAVTNYSYNATTGLLSQMSWTVPQGSNIQATPSVLFTYDNVGNRLTMVDGLGSVNYEYNQLSQMTAESRFFNELPNAPYPSNRYRLEYSYDLGGKLKSYKDPGGRQINYTHDKVGKLNAVVGTSTSGTVNYASNPHYRAWGALTHLDYGNGTEMNVGNFNNRLQATTFNVKKGTTDIINKTYSFHTDGQVKLETDNLNSKFNRSYMFDHVERIRQARSGAEATGGTSTPTNIPYTNNFQYDAFGHQTQNQYTHYSANSTVNETYSNNRVTGGTYDADGNQTIDPTFVHKTYFYDAAGNMSKTYDEEFDGQSNIVQQEFLTFGGDGYLVKTATSRRVDDNPAELDANYTIRSSPLKGEVISTVDSAGAVSSTYVRANGTVVAMHNPGQTPVWTHKDPNLKSMRSTDHNGNIVLGGISDWIPKELDVTGNNAELQDPYVFESFDPDPGFIQPFESFGSLQNGQLTTYNVDGIQVPRSFFDKMVDAAFQGYFGVLERQARLSAPRLQYLTVGNKRFDATIRGANQALNEVIELDGGTIVRHWAPATESWAVNWSIVLFQTPYVFPDVKTDGAVSDDQKKRLDSAYGGLKRLLQNKKCLDFFGGFEKVKNLLKNTKVKFSDLGKIALGDDAEIGPFGAVVAAQTEGKTVTINIYGTFMAVKDRIPAQLGGYATMPGPITSTGTLKFSSDDDRATFIFLHELGHRAGVLEKDNLEKPEDTEQAEKRNNDKLYENCLKPQQ